MAPSALDVSIVSSTSKLMELLDLNEEPKENMDDMDIDLAMDVPDTPDRFAILKNDMVGGEKDVNSSVAGYSENSELLYRGVPNQLRCHGKVITESGNNKILFPHPWKDPSIGNVIEHGSSPIVNSLDTTSVSKNAHLFRRLAYQNPRLESEPFAQPKRAEHVPFSSCGHGDDRANLGADCSGVAEESASDVKIIDGAGSDREVINLLSPEIPPNTISGRNTKRKTVTGNINLDKGKGLRAEVPFRHSACVNKNGVLNLAGQHEHTGKPEKACGKLKDFIREEASRGSIAVNGCSSLHAIANSSRAPSNDCKGATTVDDTYMVTAVASDHMKNIEWTHDSRPNTRESLQPIMSPRRTGQKRLVRNGCISPFNIARAKQTSENHGKSSVDGEQADVGGVISNGEGSSCQISIVGPDSEGKLADRDKGKRVMRDLNTAEEHNVEGMQLSSSMTCFCRGSVNHAEEDNGIRYGSGNAFRCLDGIGGWRSTRNRSKMASVPPFDEVDFPSRSDQRHFNIIENKDHVSVVKNGSATDLVEVSNQSSLQHSPTSLLAQSSSSVMSESAREKGQQRGANKLMKWQKKEGSTRSNLGACSTSTPNDSDGAYLLSSGEPPNARSIRRRNPHHRGNSGPVIVIDELSPETRGGNSFDISQLVDNDSDARARQMEADEILAQQLQEQLYSELPGAVGELDANIAWTLQQEEDARPASYRGNPLSSHPRDSSMSHLYRQYPAQSFQNLSVGSANRARAPSSARTGWLRTRFRNHSPMVSSSGRSLQFPPNMDFETRIHILEALETAVGNGNDMRLDGHLFQRDFNESDYEMLLALDENNHQHVGASSNQISSLPQSTVQTESIEEPCAICLETPSTGNIIRHLPCLHKFHKDCIDPWLRRRRSCPICKFSIT
ncbi:uncharacterized protein LOC122668917 isoform X2 [Telopea speciosissima]|uniref:uncharacterized protein LOC122668917 isoform X2 n=1 Tax=Telopea speciosissima TaxID=54955 RepID=UPI001CC48BC0|nr:uncharacterized protein LOC122668917 isoform X2 [Telopea speciosissima]